MLANWVLGFLAVLSCGLVLWQWLAALRFPLHQRVAEKQFFPPVTLLKPLKDCDAETKRCLQSWFAQDYDGPVQILFGVASQDDPVCELVRQLHSENPQVEAALIVCAESLGPNAKISTLIQLEKIARHEVVVISDADVCVSQDFLANAVQPLADEKVGLVNCFYRLANPSTIAMHWEAIAINADFWSQVLQSQTLKPLDFALGAAMATRRAQLKQIGGFESLVDFLADDYQLGNKIARTGKQIVLSPVVVECWEAPMNWKRVWVHQLRWARTIRVCQPAPF
ncbi:MAG: glycosyltransferase, partial [Verrucomicrobiota bacterium]